MRGARVGVALGAIAMTLVVTHDSAIARGREVVPDSSCANESTFKSTSGDVKALLRVINKTGETLQLIWLDYDGKRVFYQDVPPQATISQETFLSHPWIVTNAQGGCYRLVVMNAQAQTVEVKDATSGLPVDPAPTTSTSTTLGTSSSSGRERVAPPRPNGNNGGDNGISPIAVGAGAVAAAAAAGGAGWAVRHRRAR